VLARDRTLPYTPRMRLLSTALLAATFALPFAAVLHAQEWAQKRLEASPRHREFITIPEASGRKLTAYVVYPEVKEKAPVVVLIHEIFGLSDWAREMADELAAQGYIVVAPDLLTGAGPNGGNSDSFPTQDATTRAVGQLPPDQVITDLDAAADYGKKLPSASGRLVTAGFCWGGGKAFAFATHRKDLSASLVFYGTPPPDVTGINAPVYGFYGQNDARVSSTVPIAQERMKAAGLVYEPVIYDGAGHGFMRAGEDPTATGPMVAANQKARNEAFARLVTLMKPIVRIGAAMPQRPRASLPMAPADTMPAPHR
jgi:carboxymethylenebutenolidase